jgi:hypothetical protein
MDRPTPHFFLRDRLSVEIYPDGDQLAAAAAEVAAGVLHDAIRTRGKASVIFATANSQLKFLAALTALREPAVDWSKVVMFHMDEYLGLPADHPASFRRSMRTGVEEVLRPAAFHYLEGDAMPSVPTRICCKPIRRTFVASASGKTAISRSTIRRSPTSPIPMRSRSSGSIPRAACSRSAKGISRISPRCRPMR